MTNPNMVPWLRSFADKRDKDGLTMVDVESLGRVADEIERQLAEGAAIRAVVDEQAEDEGLWFDAMSAPEAYLQAELRRLHEVIEGKAGDEIAQDLVSTRRACSHDHLSVRTEVCPDCGEVL